MRRLLLLALLGLPVPAAAEGDGDWYTTTADARLALEQKCQGEKCRVECKQDEKVLWSLDRKLADKTEPRFLSSDGEWVLVFYPFPLQAQGLKAEGLALFKRGVKQRSFAVGQFVKRQKPLINAGKHYYWLEGALRQAGSPPGLMADGKGVEFTTLDSRRWVVGFDGKVLVHPKAKAR